MSSESSHTDAEKSDIASNDDIEPDELSEVNDLNILNELYADDLEKPE